MNPQRSSGMTVSDANYGFTVMESVTSGVLSPAGLVAVATASIAAPAVCPHSLELGY